MRQTLDFALATKTPATRLPNQSKRAFQAKVAELLLSMLGITHTQDTCTSSSLISVTAKIKSTTVTVEEQLKQIFLTSQYTLDPFILKTWGTQKSVAFRVVSVNESLSLR